MLSPASFLQPIATPCQTEPEAENLSSGLLEEDDLWFAISQKFRKIKSISLQALTVEREQLARVSRGAWTAHWAVQTAWVL